MKHYLLTLILLIFLISCNYKTKKENILIIKDQPKDTIYLPKNMAITKTCQDQVKGYKNKYGIIFSNYYTDEHYNLNFGNDKIIDTIAVLKPFYQKNIDDCYPKNAEYDFPILIVSDIDNKGKKNKIYRNILKNNEANYYEEISVKKDGFIISKDYNGNNGFYTKTYVSFKQNDFYVDSISVESWGEHQYKKTIKFKSRTFELSKYNRTYIDSIRKHFDN
ncbi:hypothetical protein [Flavobacterium sp. FlaQc-47]|uniref:hypothetical protein n=1 Tax=Flavobacterium sp. FlaQc-47 TaxID=3374180 RepID=UPI0037570362